MAVNIQGVELQGAKRANLAAFGMTENFEEFEDSEELEADQADDGDNSEEVEVSEESEEEELDATEDADDEDEVSDEGDDTYQDLSERLEMVERQRASWQSEANQKDQQLLELREAFEDLKESITQGDPIADDDIADAKTVRQLIREELGATQKQAQQQQRQVQAQQAKVLAVQSHPDYKAVQDYINTNGAELQKDPTLGGIDPNDTVSLFHAVNSHRMAKELKTLKRQQDKLTKRNGKVPPTGGRKTNAGRRVDVSKLNQVEAMFEKINRKAGRSTKIVQK